MIATSKFNNTYCSKCSLDYCKTCPISIGKEVCIQCLDTFLKIKNEIGFIKSCEYFPYYVIDKEKCIKAKENLLKIFKNIDRHFIEYW